MPENEKFSEEEAAALEEALGDGFYVNSGGQEKTLVDVAEFIPNPLWGSKVIISTASAEQIIDSLEGDCEEFQDALSDIEDDGPPKWMEDQPHKFEHGRLKAYFKEKYEAHKLEDLYRASPWARPEVDGQTFDEEIEWQRIFDCYRREPPYSKTWYELKIYERFQMLDYAMGEKWAAIGWTVTQACELGRMIEHYRWKFSHESNVLRARSSEKNLQKAKDNRLKKAPRVRAEKDRALIRIYQKITIENPSLIRSDSAAAIAIENHIKAERHSDSDARLLIIKKTGAPIGSDSIRKKLGTLRKEGIL
ncbi:MAG: hypothetical protein ABJO09_10550 [Hyphomicrobiales bacterium]